MLGEIPAEMSDSGVKIILIERIIKDFSYWFLEMDPWIIIRMELLYETDFHSYFIYIYLLQKIHCSQYFLNNLIQTIIAINDVTIYDWSIALKMKYTDSHPELLKKRQLFFYK